jgi:hypothetical protein
MRDEGNCATRYPSHRGEEGVIEEDIWVGVKSSPGTVFLIRTLDSQP